MREQLMSMILVSVCSLFNLSLVAGATESLSHKQENALEHLAQRPVRDLRAYPQIMAYLSQHKVYVSLTSSPIRAWHIPEVLATLDLTYVERVFVSLPQRYRGELPYSQVDLSRLTHFPKVSLLRPPLDRGPITKLVPAVEYVRHLDPKALVITVDDDIAYAKGMINELIYQSLSSCGVVASGSGQNLDFWQIEAPFPQIKAHPSAGTRTVQGQPRYQRLLAKMTAAYILARTNPPLLASRIASRLNLAPHGLPATILGKTVAGLCNAANQCLGAPKHQALPDASKFVDVVEGFAGIAYVAGEVDTDLIKRLTNLAIMTRAAGGDETAARSCFTSDDLVINFVLALSGLQRKRVQNAFLDVESARDDSIFELPYGFGEDALHRGAGSGLTGEHVNSIKYQRCHALLMSIAYDEEAQSFRDRQMILARLGG